MSNSPILSQYLTPEEQQKVYTRIELLKLASTYPTLVFFTPNVNELYAHHKSILKKDILSFFDATGKPSRNDPILDRIKADGRFHYFEKISSESGVERFKLVEPTIRKFRCLERIKSEHFGDANASPSIGIDSNNNESFNSESSDTSGKRPKRSVVSMSGPTAVQLAPPFYTYANDLNKMQTKLKNFNTLEEFDGMSRSNDFLECRYQLRDFVFNPGGTNMFPNVKKPEVRCKLWANTVTSEYDKNKIGWARRLDDYRRTVTYFLKFLYKSLHAGKFSKEKCVEALRETLIQELVSLTLPMDRANCLYHMCIKLPGQGRGMAWYAESQTDDASKAGIKIKLQKHTMNKFYLYFKDNKEFKLDEDPAIKDYWFDIEKKPEYSTTRSDQVPDVVAVADDGREHEATLTSGRAIGISDLSTTSESWTEVNGPADDLSMFGTNSSKEGNGVACANVENVLQNMHLSEGNGAAVVNAKRVPDGLLDGLDEGGVLDGLADDVPDGMLNRLDEDSFVDMLLVSPDDITDGTAFSNVRGNSL